MQRGKEDKYRFRDLEHLTRWLVGSKWGQAVLRDALYSGKCAEVLKEFVDREYQPTYVLVKAFGDGWVEVYGERHVRAQIIELPSGNAEQEKLLDEWVSLNVRLPYQEIDYPSNKRAAAMVKPASFGEFVRGIADRELCMAFLEGCNRIKQ